MKAKATLAAARRCQQMLALSTSRSRVLILTAAATALAGLVLFVETADDQAEPDGQSTDWKILKALRKDGAPNDPIGPPWVTEVAEEVSAFGGVAPLAAISTLTCVGLLLAGKRRSAATVAASFVGGLLLSEGLKRVFSRGRPPKEYRVGEVKNASFPSGHALLSAVTYLSIGAVLARAMPKLGLKIYAMGAATATALSIGATRTYLGLHWANDVLGGWGLGAMWAMLCWLGLGETKPKSKLGLDVLRRA